MPQGLSWKIRESAGGVTVDLSGDLSGGPELRDLPATLARLRGHLGSEQTFLDLTDVPLVTSAGILRFVELASAFDRPLKLVGCQPPLIRAILLASELRSKVIVESLFLPYACDACGTESAALVPGGPELKSAVLAPGPPCPRCGALMVLDELPEIYARLFYPPVARPAAAPARASSGVTTPSTPGGELGTLDLTIIGQTILDQFRILRSLGSGGMGTIYLAEQINMDRHAAIKVLRPANQRGRERFQREARAASRLAHPNIVTVYNFGELDDGKLFLAMEYIDGTTLKTVIADGGPMPVPRALSIGCQCASALAAAHEHGIVHRDLKPDNIMLVPHPKGEQVKILDFGVAALAGEPGDTGTGELVGTPQYMSPEQFDDAAVGAASDQYSLGLILYEMITGKPVAPGRSWMSSIVKHLGGQVPPMTASRNEPAVRLIEPLVVRMLEKRPDGRYPSMADVLAALETVSRKLSPADATGPSARPIDPAPAAEREERVHFVGKPPFGSQGDRDTFRTLGFQVSIPLNDPRDLPPEKDGLFVLGLGENDWKEAADRWIQAGLPIERTLVCFDADALSSAVPRLVRSFSKLMAGAFPLAPEHVAAALRWSLGSDDLIDHLTKKSISKLCIVSSDFKGHYVDTLVEDLRSNGVRSTVQTAVRGVSEEMLMNALFSAPVDRFGRRLYSTVDRAATVSLPAGKEANLRWAADDDSVVVSTRDAFGSLHVDELIKSIFHAGEIRLSQRSTGAGLGLHMMLQSSSALLIGLIAGRYCDVTSIVSRRHAVTKKRVLCVLRGESGRRQQIGNRLWVEEVERRAEQATLALEGEINETSDLGMVYRGTGEVTLVLEHVRLINSMGVLRWVEAARAKGPKLRVIVERCSPVIVDQLGLLNNLVPPDAVRSIVLPYFCGECEKEHTEVMDVTSLRAELERQPFPARSCPSCGAALELDRIPDAYFSCLGR